MTTSATNQSQQIKDYQLFLMGHRIFNAGQSGQAIYIVVVGEVTLYRGETPIKTLRPGEFLDETDLKAAGRHLSAVAKTNCHLVAVDQKIRTVLEQYPPDFRVEAIQVMVERLTRRVSPPIQLVVRPPTQPDLRSSVQSRSISDSFSLASA
jgi:CRP-like cAMP-binding protein